MSFAPPFSPQVPVEFVPRKAGGTRKRLRDAKEEKQRKLRIPQPPQGQYGAGGDLGQGTGGTLLTQHLLKEKGALRPRSQEMDPREAILRHAEAAAKDPKFVETAYLETQARGGAGVCFALFCSVRAGERAERGD